MPAQVQQPLAVLFTLPGGVTYHRRLHDLPNQRPLRSSLIGQAVLVVDS